MSKRTAMGVIEQQSSQERPVPTPHQSEVAIRVQNLSKCYLMYHKPQDRLKQSLYPRLQRLAGRAPRNYFREFWALRDVSFEVKKGETVGIIGRNGSGKSTLLQLICGTLTPTAGTVEIHGRMAALLELGAGFNPEFTGRENVYLNAAVLGLSKDEIDARFDDIAAFADIGEFIEQPVKIYSSGMYVRLAFAVVINVDPEILIVDEALAVGDASFQAKCMIRMRQIMDDGATVLFVSHDLAGVKALCSRAALLEGGRLLTFGNTEHIADEYVRLLSEGYDVGSRLQPPAAESIVPGRTNMRAGGSARFRQLAAIKRLGNRKAEFLDVQLYDASETPGEAFRHGDTIDLHMVIVAREALPYLAFGYHIRDRNGVDVAYADNLLEGAKLCEIWAGETFEVRWRFPVLFANGQYNIAVVLSSPAKNVTERVSCSDLVICDFVAVAAQFKVYGDQQIFGYVHLPNDIKLMRSDANV